MRESRLPPALRRQRQRFADFDLRKEFHKARLLLRLREVPPGFLQSETRGQESDSLDSPQPPHARIGPVRRREQDVCILDSDTAIYPPQDI